MNSEKNKMAEQKSPRVERLTAKKFRRRKGSILSKIVPISLVPLGTANVMIFMGANKTKEVDGNRSCAFDLPLILLLTGTVSIGMVLMGVAARYILEWIVESRYVSRLEQHLLTLLEWLGVAMAVAQLGLLAGCSFNLFLMIGSVQFSDQSRDDYCEYGMVVFSSTLMGITWFFLLFAVASYAYIVCVARPRASERYKVVGKKGSLPQIV